MPDTIEPRWLDSAGVGLHLSLRPAAVRRLTAAGKLPRPSYHLGPRTPRWDRERIDSLLAGRVAEDDGDAVFARISDGIRARGKKTARQWQREQMAARSKGASRATTRSKM